LIRSLHATLVVAVATATTACSDDRIKVEVRTTFPDGLLAAVEESFEVAHPDLDVRFSEASLDASLGALRQSEVAPFDVWWGVPPIVLYEAANEGLLQAYEPPWSQQADRPAYWHTVLTTPFVIAFNRTTVPLADAPTDWIDVFHHAWYDDLRALDPGRTREGAYFAGAMIVEALRDDDDLDRGFEWLARLHEQVDAYVGEPNEAVRALQRDEALIAILPRAGVERARAAEAPWIHYRVPESGTPELALGVAIVADTRQSDAARAFVDHLGMSDIATLAKLYTHWEPQAGRVDEAALPADFELAQSWRAYAPAIDTLATELDGWVERWSLEIGRR